VRYAWYIAAKEILQTRRDRMAFLFSLVMPVVFTLFFGWLLGGLSEGDDRLPLGIADLDGGPIAAELVALLDESVVVAPEAVSADAADKEVDDDQLAAALVIPQDFSTRVDAGEPVTLTIIRVQASTGAQSAEEEVRAALERVGNARSAAQVALEVTESSGDRAAAALSAAQASLATPALEVTVQESGSEAGQIPRGFDQSSPGMVVNFIMFSLLTAATGMVMERRTMALPRLMTTRTPRAGIVGGKFVSMFLLSLTTQVILIALGQFLFGVDYLRSPTALVLVMLSLSALAAALGMMIATLLTSEQAIIATTVIASMMFSALGGAWFPLEVTGEGFSTVAHFLPTAWILDAFHGIILKGWGPIDVLPAVGVALAYALVFLGIAVFKFSRE
jgi:ABC-2 type transport system permease protein